MLSRLEVKPVPKILKFLFLNPVDEGGTVFTLLVQYLVVSITFKCVEQMILR